MEGRKEGRWRRGRERRRKERGKNAGRADLRI